MSRFLDQWEELRTISSVAVKDANGGHDVRLDPASDMALHPFAFLLSDAVYFVIPSEELAAGKAAAVNREVGFDRPKRAGALGRSG